MPFLPDIGERHTPQQACGEKECTPVVTESELAKHFSGILGGALHGSHTGCLLTAVVLQGSIVQRLQTQTTLRRPKACADRNKVECCTAFAADMYSGHDLFPKATFYSVCRRET